MKMQNLNNQGETEEEKDDKEAKALSMSRLRECNRSEFPYLILGLFGTVTLGVLPPCEGKITGKSANLRRHFYH